MIPLNETNPNYEPCSGCGELLDVTNFAPLDKAVCPYCQIETRVKRIFGNYELQRRFAIGGMSVVFVACDKTLNREVAIKVLNEEYCTNETRIAAFENEARLTAAVNHTNVIDVYTAGRAYGRFYLVMELLQGESFERIMSKRGALPEDEVLDVARQITEGLKAAKDSGMIHRDVKPGNIIVDETGHTKLLDFGLALITHGGSAQADEIWATPFYVPPEVLARGVEDFRSDIYAFGATLYHALAGRPPFETTSTSNSVLRRAKQTIPRLTKVAKWISPTTGELVDRMMAFKPEDRWSSYHEILEKIDMAKLTAGQGPTKPVQSETRRNVRKKKQQQNILLGVAAFLLIVGLLILWKPWKTKKKPAVKQAPSAVVEPEPIQSWTPKASQDNDADHIAKAWDHARSFVKKRQFFESEKRFIQLASDTSLPGSTQAFALLEASTSAHFDGRSDDARRHASNLISKLGKKSSNSEVERSLLHFGKALQQVHHPYVSDFTTSQSIVDHIGNLTLSLKLWEHGRIQHATTALKKIQDIEIREGFEWFAHYQEITKIYLADSKILSPLDELPKPDSAEQARAQISLISQALDQIKTRGRARYNLRSRQAYISRIKKGLESRPAASGSLSWPQTVDRARQLCADFQFATARNILQENTRDAPANSAWAWQFLVSNGSGFIDDLSLLKNWEVQTNDAVTLQPAGITPTGITLKGGHTMAFKNLDPKSLIRAHTRSRETADPATNRYRLIHAICFAWLLGMTEIAEDQAETLSEKDDAFRENWKRVLSGISR